MAAMLVFATSLSLPGTAEGEKQCCDSIVPFVLVLLGVSATLSIFFYEVPAKFPVLSPFFLDSLDSGHRSLGSGVRRDKREQIKPFSIKGSVQLRSRRDGSKEL